MSVDHWYLLPVGFGIAVLAMSSGVSAGNFWVPVYLLWARLDPPLAFWMTLATMLCGYGSGVVRNLLQGTINRRCITQYLPYTVPAAVVGGYLAPWLSVTWLILLFGVFVLSYGVRMLRDVLRGSELTPPHPNLPPPGGKGSNASSANRVPNSIDLPSPRGKAKKCWLALVPPYVRIKLSSIRQSFARLSPSLREWVGVRGTLGFEVGERSIALIGGGLLGLITVGLGELMLPRLLDERKALSPAEAVGSTVLVIFVTSLAAALVRLNGPFLLALREQRMMLLGAMLFAGPGVILGGQLGPMLARRLNPRVLRLYVAVVLGLVGFLLLVRFVVVATFSG